MSGQTNKRLRGLISLNNVQLQPRMKLADPSAPGKEIGWITSATRSEVLGKEIALGYVKRGFNTVGMKLGALAPGDAGNRVNIISVEVVSLPFL
jgi:glycine cleavage system aminomethyltransferase T